jgi:hypothetical protein
MTTNMEDLNHARKRRYVFENVSNDLLSNGFTVSSYACQSKWKNLLRSCKSCKDHKNKTGRGPSRFLFFEKMDLLGEKPSNKCEHTLESSNLLHIEDVAPSPSSSRSVTSTELTTEDDSAVSISSEEQNNGPTKKRAKKTITYQSDFICLKKIEYAKRQKRHEEKLAIQKEKLKVEQEKINILKQLLMKE